MKLLDQLVTPQSITPVCPRCKRVIPSEDVNVAKDIAFCRNCDLSHSLSTLTSGVPVDEDVDVSRPPAGTWFQRTGDGMVLGATHRAIGQAFGLLLFCLFWNGIVSVFVMLALAATLRHLGVTLPHWLPISKGSALPLPMTIFLWLFLTPFLGIGALLLGSFLSSLAGRTEITIERGQGTLFSGIGPLGFRKRFSTDAVKDVRIEDRSWRDNRGSARGQTQIVLDVEPKPIRFGSMFTQPRRSFIAGALKKELVHG